MAAAVGHREQGCSVQGEGGCELLGVQQRWGEGEYLEPITGCPHPLCILRWELQPCSQPEHPAPSAGPPVPSLAHVGKQ